MSVTGTGHWAVNVFVKQLHDFPESWRLVPGDVNVRGFIIDSVTGELTSIC